MKGLGGRMRMAVGVEVKVLEKDIEIKAVYAGG